MFNATVVDIKKLAKSNQDAIAAKHSGGARDGEQSGVGATPLLKLLTNLLKSFKK